MHAVTQRHDYVFVWFSTAVGHMTLVVAVLSSMRRTNLVQIREYIAMK